MRTDIGMLVLTIAPLAESGIQQEARVELWTD